MRRGNDGRGLFGSSVAMMALGVGVLVSACSGGGGGSSTGLSSTGAAVFLQDAPPVTVTDQLGVDVLEMEQLVLTFNGAALVPQTGAAVPLTLVLPAGATSLTVDVMALDTSSQLVALLGSFPAGDYTGIKFLVSAAEAFGTDLVANTSTVETVEVGTGEFVAQFKTTSTSLSQAVFLSASSSQAIFVDWQPTVTATTTFGTTTYTLANPTHAFVGGGPGGAGATPALPISDIEGRLRSVDTVAQTFTIEHHGFTTVISYDNATSFVDHDRTPLANGVSDLKLGDELEIDGTAASSGAGTITATQVRDEDIRPAHGSGHHGSGAHIEGEYNESASSSTTIQVIEDHGVVTEVDIDAATVFVDEEGRAITRADLQDRDELKITLGATSSGSSGNPLAVLVKDDDSRAGTGTPVGGSGAPAPSGVEVKARGRIANLGGSAGAQTFDLVRGSTTLLAVTTNSATKLEREHSAGPLTLQDGQFVKVEGILTGVTANGVQQVIATEVEDK